MKFLRSQYRHKFFLSFGNSESRFLMNPSVGSTFTTILGSGIGSYIPSLEYKILTAVLQMSTSKRPLIVVNNSITHARWSETFLYPEVRNLLLVNLVQNFRNRLIFAKVITKKFTGSFLWTTRGVVRGWPEWPKPPPIALRKNYKVKTTYSIYNIHIAH